MIQVERREQEVGSFANKLKLLSESPELARPIKSITEQEMAELKEILKRSGFNLNLSPEALIALGHKQFRSLDQGKGPAILESVGREKGEILMEACSHIASSSRKSQYAENGLRHTIGSFLALAVRPQEIRPTILKNLNQRVYVGYTKEEREVAKVRFSSVLPIENIIDKASNPLGGTIKVWEAIVDLSQ